MTEKQSRPNTTTTYNKSDVSTMNPVDVLHELFNLLEDYAPIWYTQETHDRVLETLVQRAH